MAETDIVKHDRQSTANAARRIIKKRLKKVKRFLPRAASNSISDIESIHKLRVATRRTIAAIDLFDSVLDKKQAKKLKKRLKQLRRLAGNARDLDVLYERLKSADENVFHGSRGEVLSTIRHDRKRAQKPVVAANKQWKRRRRKLTASRLKPLSNGAPSHRKSLTGQTIHGVVHQALERCWTEFKDASNLEVENDANGLHEMRKRAKQLKYSLEIFKGDADPNVLTELISNVASIQSRLGQLNDQVTAERFYRNWAQQAKSGRSRAAFHQLAEQAQQKVVLSQDDFRAWWTEDRMDEMCRQMSRILPRDVD